ncbi:MAG: hypothetical protein KC910_14860 [Candidatus Eremiobacteraeota bacterium]|nr:hypothetical protein [Candidatus Eremiobacteraeota bacterium]
MASIQNLRHFATDLARATDLRYHRTLAPAAEVAESFKDAFETLGLEHQQDPMARGIAGAVKGLEQSWAGHNPERLWSLYETGLLVAGACLGSPLGVGLAAADDQAAASALDQLVKQAGAASQDLVELVVPEQWTRGQATSSEWQLGQARGLLLSGHADHIQSLPWMRYLEGQSVSASRIDQELARMEDFRMAQEERGWKMASGREPLTLHGQKVAFMLPEDGQLKVYEGTVVAPRRGSAFQLAGVDREFSSNEIWHQYVEPR